METLKFDPHVNWLPPCYASTSEFHAINPLDDNDLNDMQQDEKENAADDEAQKVSFFKYFYIDVYV
jgi:hypothetical protein